MYSQSFLPKYQCFWKINIVSFQPEKCHLELQVTIDTENVNHLLLMFVAKQVTQIFHKIIVFSIEIEVIKNSKSKRKIAECSSLNRGYDLQEKLLRTQEAVQYTNIESWKTREKQYIKMTESIKESNVGRKVQGVMRSKF